MVSDEENNTLAPCYLKICVNSGHWPCQWLNRLLHTRSADPILLKGIQKYYVFKQDLLHEIEGQVTEWKALVQEKAQITKKREII